MPQPLEIAPRELALAVATSPPLASSTFARFPSKRPWAYASLRAPGDELARSAHPAAHTGRAQARF